TGYCAGWSLKQLIQEGLGGIPGKITSAPAKHLSTLCNQMVNFLGIMQNEWAGAQAFSSFDTYLAPFVKVDNLNYDQVKKALESFIYGVNTPSRWGTQAPFSNITLDWVVPNDMAEMNAIVGGKEMDFKYKDCKPEMDMINKAFLEIMIEGDANGRGFQYPIPTYSITADFDWADTENNRLLFEMTAKYGTPYFSNYINSDMEPSDVRSMCCRLRLDLRELRKKSGGFFGSGESTGSVGVVTINMPRIAYQSENEADFYRRLDKMMDISARSLKLKRTIITRLLDEGLYPYTKRYLGNFDSHFSTIGLVGMNEACRNAKWIQKDLTDEKAQQFTKDVLNHMRERLSDYQEMYGDLYNLEATPAESTSYRLAKHDIERYPDIITASEPNDTPYYTNSSHLPVGYTEDIFAALDIQDELQTLYTSGTVFHAFLGEKLPDWQSAASLVRKIAENYKLPYYTLSPTYSICKDHGYISGEVYECPICGAKTEVYSRITGYYRPVQNWNDGKSKEFKDRKVYDISRSVLKRVSDAGETQEIVNIDAVSADTPDTVLLFTTQTCPNCKIAETFLQKANVPYQKVVAEENASLVQQYSIMKAPTLIVQHEGKVTKYDNASDIRRYSDSVTK
ncbi:MAG: ribonucleoside triphosphate reductase, partial [Peptococcaceae bacterium]|nr:ribonucleoside triphosphate reductase [Peptococcaceae bacterium]